MASPAQSLRQSVAVLFSESTLAANREEAQKSGAVYTFQGADGEEHEWLKGWYAYLAPAGTSTFLNRCNIKHDVISERDIREGCLSEYQTLFLSSCGSVDEEAIQRITSWLEEEGPDRFLVISGSTNLPPALIGMADCETLVPTGHTGWTITATVADQPIHRWRDQILVSGYHGHPVLRGTAASSSRVLGRLWQAGESPDGHESGDIQLGDGIVLTDRTLLFANPVFEFIGGGIQAQMNVDALRDRVDPSHLLDEVGAAVRRALDEATAGRLFSHQLRSFGTYRGMVVFRHDTDVSPGDAVDLSMLDWQIANHVPATYVVLDPVVSPEHTTESASQTWIAACRQSNLIEVGLHNDGFTGQPPIYVAGREMYEHFRDGDQRLGIESRTAGRHYGFHRHPETLDAMDYLYDHSPGLLGLCTFSVLQVIEYSQTNTGASWLGQPVTYSTRYRADNWTSGAVPGWWFPFHPVITTTTQHRSLRGWDSTKESECDFDRIDDLFRKTTLPNGVFTVQYHPQDAIKPSQDRPRGSLPHVQYLALSADRHGYGVATKQEVYETLNAYEAARFRVGADGASILTGNTGEETLTGLMATLPGPVGRVDGDGFSCIHIVDESTFTLPSLPAGAVVALRPSSDAGSTPLISQSNSRELAILEAVQAHESGEIAVELRAVAHSYLTIVHLAPEQSYRVRISGGIDEQYTTRTNEEGTLTLPVRAPASFAIRLRIEISTVVQ
jgi:hypothetical protein